MSGDETGEGEAERESRELASFSKTYDSEKTISY